jgi:hypothetical protein
MFPMKTAFSENGVCSLVECFLHVIEPRSDFALLFLVVKRIDGFSSCPLSRRGHSSGNGPASNTLAGTPKRELSKLTGKQSKSSQAQKNSGDSRDHQQTGKCLINAVSTGKVKSWYGTCPALPQSCLQNPSEWTVSPCCKRRQLAVVRNLS